MHYRTLGKTGLKVSEVGFGAFAIGGKGYLGKTAIGWHGVDDESSIAALETAFDCGINFYDTADVYGNGHSEEIIGRVFQNRRSKVIIASKGGNRTVDGEWKKDFSPEWITEAVEQSLKRLRTDYIDVYQLHSPGTSGQFKESLDCFETLDKLKEQGKIRFYGVSIGPVEHGIEIINYGKGEVLQVLYNILKRGCENELLPLAEKNDIGIIARVPLASGFLTGKYTVNAAFPPEDHRSHRMTPELLKTTIEKVDKLSFLTKDKNKTLAQAAIQFVLSSHEISVVIPGAKNPSQVKENALASDGKLLSEDEIEKIHEIIPSE